MSKKTILFIAHAPSVNTATLRDAACHSIEADGNVTLIAKSPFDCTHEDALAADGIIIGTTENIGAMAGATKDFFDRSYNHLLDVSAGKPVAVYIRAGLDGTGTKLDHRHYDRVAVAYGGRTLSPKRRLARPIY